MYSDICNVIIEEVELYSILQTTFSYITTFICPGQMLLFPLVILCFQGFFWFALDFSFCHAFQILLGYHLNQYIETRIYFLKNYDEN